MEVLDEDWTVLRLHTARGLGRVDKTDNKNRESSVKWEFLLGRWFGVGGERGGLPVQITT